MNPFGILIGWLLSNQGNIVRGVFQAISAGIKSKIYEIILKGTFIYIATGEVILNEFNRKRFRFLKFVLFMLAIGFVCVLYAIKELME